MRQTPIITSALGPISSGGNSVGGAIPGAEVKHRFRKSIQCFHRVLQCQRNVDVLCISAKPEERSLFFMRLTSTRKRAGSALSAGTQTQRPSSDDNALNSLANFTRVDADAACCHLYNKWQGKYKPTFQTSSESASHSYSRTYRTETYRLQSS